MTPTPYVPPAGTEAGTWHWLEVEHSGQRVALKWDIIPEIGTRWRNPLGSAVFTPAVIGNWGYRYLFPVAPPDAAATIDRLTREVAQARQNLESWIEDGQTGWQEAAALRKDLATARAAIRDAIDYASDAPWDGQWQSRNAAAIALAQEGRG